MVLFLVNWGNTLVMRGSDRLCADLRDLSGWVYKVVLLSLQKG